MQNVPQHLGDKVQRTPHIPHAYHKLAPSSAKLLYLHLIGIPIGYVVVVVISEDWTFSRSLQPLLHLQFCAKQACQTWQGSPVMKLRLQPSAGVILVRSDCKSSYQTSDPFHTYWNFIEILLFVNCSISINYYYLFYISISILWSYLIFQCMKVKYNS